MPYQELSIEAADGWQLGARLYQSNNDNDAANTGSVVVFNSAMAVRQRFYEPFAEFLMARGHVVITYDYRGIGESCTRPLRQTDADITSWGELDQDAVIAWALHNFPQRKLVLAGHSVGGQIMGLTRHGKDIDALVTIGSQSGYWGHWDGVMRWQVFLLWHLFIPVLSRIMGYFPSSWFGIGLPLPAGVARQWARWGRDPAYLHGRQAPAGSERYAQLDRPMLVLWIADDTLATYRANAALRNWYSAADIDYREIHPEDFGRSSIGHFPVFRPEVGQPVWRMIAEWIESR